MTKILLSSLVLSISAITHSQINTVSLAANNNNVLLSDAGIMFTSIANNFPGFEVPAGSGKNVAYTAGIWIGGFDVNGQLKMSAQSYTAFGDQFKGPLTEDGTALPDQSGNWSNSIFHVTKAEIDNHIANYSTPGYIIPQSIADWPAHGDISNNFAFNLAPFVDANNDGVYDPSAGDYPCIRGDEAVYIIMNDKGGVHETGADPIGIELHYMFYQYATIPELRNTTFLNLRVINRGTQTLYDAKSSIFLDGDIGYYGDDYFGSDSLRNVMYFYNGQNFDQVYQSDPPAFGVVSLDNDFESIGSFSNNAVFPYTDPSLPLEYSSWMNGTYSDGSSWLDAVTGAPTKFMYNENPDDVNSQDSEFNVVNQPGDRRGIASVNQDYILPLSQEFEMNLAFVYAVDTTSSLASVTALLNSVDSVQNFYNNYLSSDNCNSVLDITDPELGLIQVSPNPSKNHFYIKTPSDYSNSTYTIIDLAGKTIVSSTALTGNKTEVELNVPAGLYLVRINLGNQQIVRRIMIE